MEYMPTDKQFNAQLIDEYFRLKRVLQLAKQENALATVELITEEMRQIKLKLQPINLEETE